jgi:hypothetical protein
MTARKALRFMNANYLAALGACPSFLFICNELPNANLPDAIKIVDHAHAILCPVALIQMIHPGARIIVTIETITGFVLFSLLTVFDSARQA